MWQIAHSNRAAAGSVEETRKFTEPAAQAMFVRQLTKRGVDFHTSEDGTVIYKHRDSGAVDRASRAVLDTYYQPGSTWIADARMRQKLISYLKSKNIQYSIHEVDGKKFIGWEKKYDEQVNSYLNRMLESNSPD